MGISRSASLLVKLSQGVCIIPEVRGHSQASNLSWNCGAPMAEVQGEHALLAACQQAG